MSKIKSVSCGCGEEHYVRKTAQRHPETCIVMCAKCGHRWLVGQKPQRQRREDEEEG